MSAVSDSVVGPTCTGSETAPIGDDERTLKVATPLALEVAEPGTTVSESWPVVIRVTAIPSSGWLPSSRTVTVTVDTPCPSPTTVDGEAETDELVAETAPVTNETTGCCPIMVRSHEEYVPVPI